MNKVNKKYAAIIAEYNPMHNGHIFHISDTIRAIQPSITIIIMSGAFTQRGHTAILDKYTRATHAIQAGADIVIELPTIFALSNAEYFAKGAIKLLSPIEGEGYLSFGSECGDINLLNSIASLMAKEPKEVSESIKAYLKSYAFPYARAQAYLDYATKYNIEIPDITSPNNMLALEYIKAIIDANSSLIPYTVKREGATYHSLNIEEKYISSRTARAAIKEGKLCAISDKIPSYVYADLSKVKNINNSAIILHKLQSMSKDELGELYDITEGLENRLKKYAESALNYQELSTNIQTKRYTASRLQRIMAYALLNITKSLHSYARAAKPYYNILAINSKHTDFLSNLSEYGEIYTTNNQLVLSDNPLARLDAKAYNAHRVLTEQAAPHSMVVINK